MFRGYTKLVDECQKCGEKLSELRADDFPPYVTMFLVGHIIVPLVLLTERFYAPSMVFHLLVWLPLAALLSVYVLPRVKGLIVGWMMYLGIRGDETY